MERKTETTTDHSRGRRRLGALVVILALVLILLGGYWVLQYFSQNPFEMEPVAIRGKVEKPSAQRPEEPEQGGPSTTPDPGQEGVEKRKAEEMLAGFLQASGELDRMGVSKWGGETYVTMIRLSREGDSHFKKGEYSSALEKYEQAGVFAGQLTNEVGEVLGILLEEGYTAMSQGYPSLSQEKFHLALMIDPSNSSARKGLKRAGTMDMVRGLVVSGEEHEKRGDLSLALVDYQKALEADPESKEARVALDRVKGLIKEEQFQQMMSQGLAAFYGGDYRTARDRLLKAKSLDPQSIEVLDALSQLDQAIQLDKMESLQEKARKAEQEENWQLALKCYLAALDLDKNVQFARKGKDLALERIRLTKRLRFFLEKPSLLDSDDHLKNAILLLNYCDRVRKRGPKLTAQIGELQGLVEIAQTPVKITFESDGLTEVAVYKVGKLGTFSLLELELRPGTYTVVGARSGYKDVRQQVVVRPSQTPLRVSVKCTTRI